MTGEELCRCIMAYATKAGYHFFGRSADADDLTQDAMLMCLELPAKYPTMNDEGLQLMARRAVWNRAIDILRRSNTRSKACASLRCSKRLTAPAEYEPEHVLIGRDLVRTIAVQLAEKDLPVFELAAEGHGAQEIQKRTGRGNWKVFRSLQRIRAVAERVVRVSQ